MITTKKETLKTITSPVKSSRIFNGARNSFVIDYEDGSTAYRFHKTDVLTLHDGKITLNSGGWRTTSTKERISQFMRLLSLGGTWYISQSNGIWHVTTPAGTFDYFDGITFNRNGKPDKVKVINLKNIDDMKLKIKKFVSKLDKMKTLPIPNGGDCWYCHLKTQDGKTMGEMSHNDHLLSHVKEGYLHGSLIVNALKSAGYRDEQIPFLYSLANRPEPRNSMKTSIKRNLTKYLQKNLIKDIAV